MCGKSLILCLKIVLFHVLLGTSDCANTTLSCVIVYELENITDSYQASCSVLRYQCSGYHAVSANCKKYLQCAHLQIYECSCGDGTSFDRESGQCLHDYEADCSCPPEPTKNVSTIEDPNDAEEAGFNSVTTLIGVVGGVVALIVISVVIVCIYKKRKTNDEKKGLKGDLGEPTYITVSETYASIDDATRKGSEKSSGGYLYPQVADGVAPPIPDRTVTMTTENIYDNNVTKETNDTNELSGSFEEHGKIVDEDSKRENNVEGVENDLFSAEL